MEKVHLIGIGGIGMSSLAQLLVAQGYRVSGSDARETYMLDALRGIGVEVFIGHNANWIYDVDKVVYSSAISKDNPELKYAKENNLAIFKRSEMLSHIYSSKKTIAIAGAHGKSSSTAMTGFVIEKLGLDPSISLGAVIEYFHSNAKHGNGEYFVVETDESDGSFLCFDPYLAVVTNIEHEHVDYYKTKDMLFDYYTRFLKKVPKQGCAVLCADCANVRAVMDSLDCNILTFGIDNKADVMAKNIQLIGGMSIYNLFYKGNNLGQVQLQVPGAHNILNSLAAAGLCLYMGHDFERVQEALRQYKGIKRRFQIIAKVDDITIVDDYAHHPTEVRAVLKAADTYPDIKRRICVFEPHRYTRLRAFMNDFSESFKHADEVIITDLYAASEHPIDGISPEKLAGILQEKGIKAYCVPNAQVCDTLCQIIRPGDMVLFLGAGDVTYLAKEFAGKISSEDVIYQS